MRSAASGRAARREPEREASRGPAHPGEEVAEPDHVEIVVGVHVPDDDRIERMFDVLTQAAEKQQVIVLTCRSRAFLSCGGRALTISREDG